MLIYSITVDVRPHRHSYPLYRLCHLLPDRTALTPSPIPPNVGCVCARASGMPRWSWTCPEVVGAAPAARTGHTALLLPDGYTIAVHGGWDPEGSDGVQNYGDCYLLDTKLWEWSRGPDSLLGDGATALRVGHTSVLTRRVGDEGEQGKEEREARWQSAFFGGQDGEGVRGAELAISSL